MSTRNQPTLFSGVQPTGNFHIGNYLGALTQWLDLQHKYRSIFCVVDYHAITVPQDAKNLKRQILDIAKIYLAAGINPKKCLIFRQSDISAHTELAWILNCAVTRMSDLNKMTQFKDKAGDKNVSVGLYDYPVLMAADILLYQTDVVPVGEDQLQHVELARDLAKRFNHQFGQTFTIPEAKIHKEAARIMGLDDPTKKMSKSAASAANFVALLDAPAAAAKKIKRAVTDSGSDIKFDPKNKPAISNLLTIYSLLAKKNIKELERKYNGKGYGDFKNDLAQIVSRFLTDFQSEFNNISDHQVEKILASGAKKLQPLARATLAKVKTKLGL
jgi:tryptophanyl-tRNA synthetase